MMKARKSSQRMKLHDTARDDESFMTYTSAHGFNRIKEADSLVYKAVWVVLLVITLSGMATQVVILFLNFRSEPTASVMTTTYPQKFPNYTYCPENWMNLTKAKEYGVTLDIYAYLMSLMSGYAGPISFVKDRVNGSTVNRTKEDLQAILDQHTQGSIDTLFLDLMVEPSYVLKTALLNVTIEKWLTITQPCYQITPHEEPMFELNTVKATELLEFRQYNETLLDINVQTFTDMFGIGPISSTIYPTNLVYMRHGLHYSGKITYTSYTRKNLRRAPCLEDTFEYHRYMQCNYECINEICERFSGRRLYVPHHGKTLTVANITSLIDEDSCYFRTQREIQAICPAICNRPCIHEGYSLSLTPFIEREAWQDSVYLFLTFQDPINSLKVEEHLIYDSWSMISNVGGTFGLWSGASLISIAEVFYYFGCRKRKND